MKKLLFLFCLALATVSCVRQKKIVYVQSGGEKTDYEYLIRNKRGIRIEPFDLLYISIGSIDQQSYNFFNSEKEHYNSISETSLAILAYTVSDSGYVSLPVIGKINIQGLTLDEAALIIRDAAQSVLSNPTVTIRFVNNYVTILGEVARPGTFTITKGQINIFSALGLAGDITEYGNRRKVALIREKDNKIHKYYIDLTKDDLFRSDFYYIRPNDVIYIEPLKIRRMGMKEFPFALIVTSITSAFLIYFYVKK